MIGLVGPAQATAELAAGLDDAEVWSGDAAQVVERNPTVVIAVGDGSVASLVQAGVTVPVAPVDTSGGLRPVAPDRVPGVLRRGLDSGFQTRELPLLESGVRGNQPSRSVFDAMVVTAEPARISEFSVEGPGWADRYRADGVVVATPVGTAGYARALGGPVVTPTADALAVVPIAAFARRSTTRVTDPAGPLTVTVERDEGEVTLLADGRPTGTVPPRQPVEVRVVDVLETVRDDDG